MRKWGGNEDFSSSMSFPRISNWVKNRPVPFSNKKLNIKSSHTLLKWKKSPRVPIHMEFLPSLICLLLSST